MNSYLGRLWGVISAEMRSSRRLVRLWIFVVISLFVTGAALLNFSVQHSTLSAVTPVIGVMANPPYLFVNQIVSSLVMFFSIGVIFLSFDLVARDSNSRMTEVLGSRPLGNVSFLMGRVLGIVLVCAIPLYVIYLLAIGFCWLSTVTEIPTAAPPTFVSTFNSLAFDILPNLFWIASLCVFLSVLLRYRVLVLIVMIGFLFANFRYGSRLPMILAEVLTNMHYLPPSQLNQEIASFATLLLRSAYVLMGVAFVYFAAVLNARPDGNTRIRSLSVGAVAFVIAALTLTLFINNRISLMDNRNLIAQSHEDFYEQHPRNSHDLQSIAGDVVLRPGKSLSFDLKLVADPNPVDNAMFALSLNPGLEITKFNINGQATKFTFEHGLILLDDSQSLPADKPIAIEIAAEGMPVDYFSFLDAQVDFWSMSPWEIATLSLLGNQASLFTKQHVFLPANIAWYPSFGPFVNRDVISNNPRDYFHLDVVVSAPQHWTVGGPGKDYIASTSGSTVFNPKAHVPEITLIADEYRSYQANIAGVELELLIHPSHARNVAIFSEVGEAIEERVADLLNSVDKVGLSYPYESLIVAELSSDVRVYGGGWRMDSTLNAPGLLMIRETGFPTTNFSNPAVFEDRRKDMTDDEMIEYKTELLAHYFHNDMHGGNIFLGFAKNLFTYQTSATNTGAEAVDYLMEILVQRASEITPGFYSTYVIADTRNTSVFWLGSSNSSEGRNEYANNLREAIYQKNSIWEAIMRIAFKELPIKQDPQTAVEILELKGGRIASSFLDGLGREEVLALLAAVRVQYGGASYTYADLVEIGETLGFSIESVAGNWLDETELAGFYISDPVAVRLPDRESGLPIYKTSINVRNGENVPGVFSVRYREEGSADEGDSQNTGTHVLPGKSSVEVAMVTNQPMENLEFVPYLSLNRRDIAIPLDDEDHPKTDEPLPETFTRSNWQPEETEGILVDDLDDAFTTDNPGDYVGFQMPGVLSFMSGFISAYTPTQDWDSGLPVGANQSGIWGREHREGSFGRYRMTTAKIPAAKWDRDGNFHRNFAYFPVDIPEDGRWQLEYHLPPEIKDRWKRDMIRRPGIQVMYGYSRDDPGTYDLKLSYADDEVQIEFDADAGGQGWNVLGEYELPRAKATLRVSNETSGNFVYADAIRWTRKG